MKRMWTKKGVNDEIKKATISSSQINSSEGNLGDVLTADGDGGVSWEAPSGGGVLKTDHRADVEFVHFPQDEITIYFASGITYLMPSTFYAVFEYKKNGVGFSLSLYPNTTNGIDYTYTPTTGVGGDVYELEINMNERPYVKVTGFDDAEIGDGATFTCSACSYVEVEFDPNGVEV